MSAAGRAFRACVCAVLAGAPACHAAPPSEPAASELHWSPLETGKRCADAAVACGRGNCAARIDNRCREPVTCSLTVQCVCRAFTGEQGEATGKSEDTILAGEAGGILARVICDDGDVLATLAKDVRCE